jgi:FlaA1/EpsC-like NDP-sugar epimerase
LATLRFRDEESLLRNARNVELFYVEQCIPRKVDLNLQYARRANLFTDTVIILQTIFPRSCGVLFLFVCLLTVSLALSSALVDASNGLLPSASAFALTVSLQAAGLIWRQQCTSLLTYFSVPEARETCIALGVPCLVLLVLTLFLPAAGLPAINVLVMNLILSVGLLCTFRMLIRLWKEGLFAGRNKRRAITRVAIIGATDSGARLAREIFSKRRLGRQVQAFFDDDAEMWHKRLHEVPIIGMPECLLQGWSAKLDEVIIAMPDASADRLQQIQQIAQKANLTCSLCPSVEQLWST